jgi:predicted metalloprotease with PDZ domain
MLIIIKSNGNKRLEHALQQMYSLYKINPHTGFTEHQIIEIIENTCEVSIQSELIHWLHGKDELPYDDIFSAFGLQWSVSTQISQIDFYGELRPFLQKPESVFCGWGIREESGKLFIREIEEGTPSAEAGIGIDDEIIAINGIRVSSIKALQDCINANGIDKKAEIIAQSDGIIYNTSFKPIKQPIYSLTINHNINSEQKHLLDYWLLRS